MTPLTLEDIANLRELERKATPPEWMKHYGRAGGGIVRRWKDEQGRRCTRFVCEVHLNTIGGEERQADDAELICASRNHLTALLDIAEQSLKTVNTVLYPKCGRTPAYVGCGSCAQNLSGSRWMKFCPECGKRILWI